MSAEIHEWAINLSVKQNKCYMRQTYRVGVGCGGRAGGDGDSSSSLDFLKRNDVLIKSRLPLCCYLKGIMSDCILSTGGLWFRGQRGGKVVLQHDLVI